MSQQQPPQIQISRQLNVPVGPPQRRNSAASNSPSEANTTITQAVAQAQQSQPRTFDAGQAQTEQEELQMLRQIIVTWRALEKEATELMNEARQKKKRQKVMEEMILRIMKKYNIGALDLTGSGGRLLYRRQSTKQTLNPKTLTGLLAQHLKSETAAADAIKYINENRGATVRESLLYEKN
jgi:hypothetical protein